jgi:hypothetical protein
MQHSQDTPLIADYSGTVHDLITTKVCDQSTKRDGRTHEET